MKKAENTKSSCLQMNSTECEGYAGAQSAVRPERGEMENRQPELLEAILDRDNLNRAYKRVKANKGAPGVDGMTVEEALPWLKEHGKELRESIREGKYRPEPVRRKEIPKPDGGVRKLGIPTVKDRIIQEAIAQQLNNNICGINNRYPNRSTNRFGGTDLCFVVPVVSDLRTDIFGNPRLRNSTRSDNSRFSDDENRHQH